MMMKKKETKRINLWLDKPVYDQIKNESDKAFLKVGTFARTLIQNALQQTNNLKQ